VKNLVDEPTQEIVTSLFYNDSRLYVGMANYQVIVFDIPNRIIRAKLQEDLWEVKSIFVDTKNIYVGTLGEAITIFDKNSFVKTGQIKHELGVTNIYVDENFIYTCSYNQKVNLYDKLTRKLLHELPNHLIRSSTVLTDSKYIITGDGFTIPGASIRFYDKKELSLVRELIEPESKRILDISFDEHYYYSSHGSPGEIRVWDRKSFQLIHTLNEKEGDIISITQNNNYIFGATKKVIFQYKKSDFSIQNQYIAENEIKEILLEDDILFLGSGNSVIALTAHSLEFNWIESF